MTDHKAAFDSYEYDRNIVQIIPYYEEFYNQTIELIKTQRYNCPSWLDVGCGTGKMAEIAFASLDLKRFVFHDFSEEMLTEAKKRFDSKKTEFHLGSALELPYYEEFDVVTAILINHYLHKNEKIEALKRYYVALKRGGIYVGFENFAPYSEYAKQLNLEKWKAYQLHQGRDPKECERHISRYGIDYFPITLSEHREILQEAGFDTAEILWVSNMQAGVFGIKL